MITGGNSGIGKETAIELAARYEREKNYVKKDNKVLIAQKKKN